MDSRVILDKEILDSKDCNLIYKTLLTSPPLLFANIARELQTAGYVAAWHQSADSSARVLASACDVANGSPDALNKLMEEIRFADKSSFENYDRIAYLADALLLVRQNNNVEYHDMPYTPVKIDDVSKELREMFGKLAEHFWRDMPEHFFLHVTSHLTQPYRIQRLSRWVNYCWPKFSNDEMEKMGIVMSSSYFLSDCSNLILKTLLSTNVSRIDKAGINEILQTEGSQFPALNKLTVEQRKHVLLSLQWTAAAPRRKSHSNIEPDTTSFPPACTTPVYKNFSGMHFYNQDFSGLDFQGANLHGAVLNRTKFKNTNLRHANLSNTSFMYSGAVFDDAPPSGADFHGSDMTGIIFQGARVEALNLNYAILQDADFRHTDVCGDSEVYTMRIAEASNKTGVSFALAKFRHSNIFSGTQIDDIDTTGCSVNSSYWPDKYMSVQSLFTDEDPQTLLQNMFEQDQPSFYLMVKLYLSAKTYNENIHQIFNTILTADPMYGARLLMIQLNEMLHSEKHRLTALYKSFEVLLEHGHLDMAELLKLRLTDKVLKQKVKEYIEQNAMLLLDYCLDFVSTAILNEVAAFCQSLNILESTSHPEDVSEDAEVDPDNGYIKLFDLLLRSRLGEKINFATILEKEIRLLTNHGVTAANLHRLTYLIETICSDQNIPLPNTFTLMLDVHSWHYLDIVVHNLKRPARLFRLAEFISADDTQKMRELAPLIPVIMRNEIKHNLPPETLRVLPAIALMSLLFLDVNWKGHQQLEDYLISLKKDLCQRYGKELCDILYQSLWTTREYPRGSSSTHQDSYYKNLTGLDSHTNFIWHRHNSGANLKGATISGGMPGTSFRYDCSDAWLKNATLIKHQNDNRRDFKGESFRGANLCGANMIDANMEGADFSHADLRHASFTNTCTKDAKFDKANCTDMHVADIKPVIEPAPEANIIQSDTEMIKIVETKPVAAINADIAVESSSPKTVNSPLVPVEPEPARLNAAQLTAKQKAAAFIGRLFHRHHNKEASQPEQKTVGLH